MRALVFIRYIVKAYPLLVIGSSLILIATSLVETVTLFFIAPIVDIIFSQGLQGVSGKSLKRMQISTGFMDKFIRNSG